MTLAKALANGVPIGACLANGKAAGLLQPGMHGSTFGGNPLACSAALATLKVMEETNINALVQKHSEILIQRLNEQLVTLDGIVEIRNFGFMVGIELDRPCAELVAKALDKYLLINVTAQNVIRLLPPLNISNEEINSLSDTLSEIVKEFLK